MSEIAGRGNGLHVGIVGGSIAGCAAAIELGRAGHSVQVFERSRGELTGRGAGIGTPVPALGALVERDLVDRDMPSIHIERMPHIGRSGPDERMGRTAWAIPVQMELLNWGDLYRNLRRRVPDAVYHHGREVTKAAHVDSGRVSVTFADKSQAEFDLVIFADGYRSLGRRLIFPGSEVRYRGYVLWRGVRDEAGLDDSGPLENALCRVSYADGHCVIHFVPSQEGAVESGRRWVSWSMYVPVMESDLPQFLVDKTGTLQPGSLPPGMMRPEEEQRLKRLARESLPPYFGDIIAGSEDTYAQPIYTADVPAYYRGRMCLAGDAGAFAQPFTAGGVFKGINNAIDLAAALSSQADVDAALAAWSREEVVTATRVYLLGQQLEDALIWSIPDFAQMSEAEMQAWWEKAAKLPEDLFPPSE